MGSIISESAFRALLSRGPVFIRESCFSQDIAIRTPERKESATAVPGPYRLGGRSERGDIVFQPASERDENIYLFAGAPFEVENLAESFLRKSLYDRVFERAGAHKTDIWKPGCWGSPFGENTPLVRFYADPENFASAYRLTRETFDRFVTYLRTIDSPQFAEAVEQVQQNITAHIDSLL